MNSTQNLWIIIGFSFDYVQGQIENKQMEHDYKHTVEGSRYIFPPEIYQRRLKNLIKKPTNRGYFTSKNLALESIEKDCEYIQERGYYIFLCLEKFSLNVLEGSCWGDEDYETWFKLSDDFEKYELCEKPEFAKGTVDFSS